MAERKRAQTDKVALRNAPTVDDVARRAGVSRTAVSYVLNEHGQRNKHVSEAARAKVLQAVQELNFRPLSHARALSKGYSEELVWIVDVDLTPFAMEMVTSIQRQASFYGYTPVMYFAQYFSAEERKALYQTIFARRPIGLIVGSCAFSAEDVAQAHEMGVNHIIFVALREVQIEGTHSIVFPSRALGYLAARHLLERGHRRLALVQPDESVQADAFLQRLEGMQAAIAEETEKTNKADKPDVSLDILPLHRSASSAQALVETSLLGVDRPTGIYAFSDEYAVVLLGALTRSGIHVPQEIALVGTDNLALGTFVWPALTSMGFDAIDMGKRTVDMLHILHQGLPLPEELTQPLVPQLIVRESS
jgi:DNA-binding LacI/PurR family transcriptional regulator